MAKKRTRCAVADGQRDTGLPARLATALRVCLAGAFGAFFGVSGTAGETPEPPQPLVYVLANDNTITPGHLEGFEEGYLLLRLPDKILRYSPTDFLGVFFSEEAAREGLKRFLLMPERVAGEGETMAVKVARDAEIVGDAEFLRALALAQEKNAGLRPVERLTGLDTLLQQARSLLLVPQTFLKPEEAVPVFQVCLMAARSRARERVEELLRQHRKLVEEAQLTQPEREKIQSRVQGLLRVLSGTAGLPGEGEKK